MNFNLVAAAVGAVGALLVYSGLLGLFQTRRDQRDMWERDDPYRMRSLADRPILDRLLGPAASDAGRLLARFVGNRERDEGLLVQAGFPKPFSSLGDFYGWKVIMAFGLFLLGLGLAGVVGSPVLLVLALGLGAFGLYLPDLSLGRDAKRRQEAFKLEMAFTLDRLALLVQAGESIERAIRHVAARGGGYFVREMRQVVGLINTRMALEEALEDVVRRFPLGSYEEIVAAILMSRERGTGLYQVLGSMSNTMQSEMENDLLAKGTSSTLPMVLGMGIALLGIVVVIGGPALYMFLVGGAMMQ